MRFVPMFLLDLWKSLNLHGPGVMMFLGIYPSGRLPVVLPSFLFWPWLQVSRHRPMAW